jgi:hypothetical protein
VTHLLRLNLSGGLDFAVGDGKLGDLAVNDYEAIASFGLWWGSSLGGTVDAFG